MLGVDPGKGIQWFFQANALISLLVLGLITLTLFREAKDFIPQNRRNLELYRTAGLEYVDIVRVQIADYRELGRVLQDIRQTEFTRMGMGSAGLEAVAPLDAFTERFDEAIRDHEGMVSEWAEVVTGLRDRVKVSADLTEARANTRAALPAVEAELEKLVRTGAPESVLAAKREQLAQMNADIEAKSSMIETIDLKAELQVIMEQRTLYADLNAKFAETVRQLAEAVPGSSDPKLAKRLAAFQVTLQQTATEAPEFLARLEAWTSDKPVTLLESFHAFAFGRQWVTASFWQDWYGVVPLFTGSFLIAILALSLAIPFGVAAAIYVNQIASARESRIVKPTLEFIAAIPSVVLGFFGIAVLGETLRWISQIEALSWVPGFPMHERLTALTAGCLLGLMAVPTIFSLAEDAINNVPRSFKEASLALGATRLQTVIRIIVPAALSGIFAAVLLGLGRVIGETMVVLLCAGNRIAIPDFSAGVGAFLQPVHTMTGIIAQEMGEVVRGSIHYRALFMVGCVLFTLSLAINYTAQIIVRRYKISVG